MNKLRSNPGFLLFLAGTFFVGAYLRVYSLTAQIFLDDEWHSVIQVIGRNYTEILARFNPHDNSSLVEALYNLALYQAWGWSEFTLRLPPLLAGLLSLIILPLQVRRLFNDRVALIFSGLLAISPFLIFYSRYARTYELMMFLCFWTLLLFHGWLTTGKFRYAAGFAVIAIFAVYTHLFSFVAVFAPLALMIGFKLVHRLKLRFPAGRQIAVSGKALCLMTFIVLLALIPLMVPVLIQSTQLPWEKGKLTWDGVITAATLLSGTANLPLNAAFFLLGILGLRWLFKSDALLGWIFLGTTGAYIIALLISRPLGLNIGSVLLRYMVVIVPLTLTAVAVGVEWLLAQSQKIKRMHRSLSILAVGSFMGCLYVTGPLPAQHVLPNNFTNHSAFQGSYRHKTWEYSEANSVYPAFSVKADQIPEFYRWLGRQTNVEAIIEYPFDICDYNDLYYYYQHFHGKQVLAGYCTDPGMIGYGYAVPRDPNKSRFSVGTLPADMVLNRVTDPTKLKFRNMVEVTDPAALLRCHADFIILHKYTVALKTILGSAKAPSTYDTIRIYFRSVALLVPRFEAAFGQPVYEDEQIICFRLEPLGPQQNQGGSSGF